MNKHLIAAVIIAVSTAATAPAFASSRYDSASSYAPVASAPVSQRRQLFGAVGTENASTATQSVGGTPETTSYLMADNDSDMLYSHH